MTPHTLGCLLWAYGTRQDQRCWLLLVQEARENLDLVVWSLERKWPSLQSCHYGPFVPVSKKKRWQNKIELLNLWSPVSSVYISSGYWLAGELELHCTLAPIWWDFKNWPESRWSSWKRLFHFWNTGKLRLRLKMRYVHGPAPHNEGDHSVLQTYTNKNKNWEKEVQASYEALILCFAMN